jgi:RND family efflux transporter MFP subunit
MASSNFKSKSHSSQAGAGSAPKAKVTSTDRKAGGALNPILIPLVVGAVGLAAFGVAPRLQNLHELGAIHEQLVHELPHVTTAIVKSAGNGSSLVLPGDLQPIQNIPIYARVNGYLSKRFVDIGDNVKAGDVLAIIDTPEQDQQVEQAVANLRAAQANLASAYSDRENYSAQLFASDATIKQTRTNLEFSTTEVGRYQELASEGAVSLEQRDQALKQFNSDTASIEVAQHNRQAQLAQVASANARIAAAKQAVESSQANLRQLKATQGFQKVVAPTDGVITNRLVDAGALVAAGGSSGTTEILSMARTDVLRIYVDVPQSDYRFIHNNDRADLSLQEFPGKTFVGTVTNIAGSLNSQSRTLQTEIRIDNHDHVLKPGSYAEVRFNYVNPNPPVVIPASAAITKNDGLYVAVVDHNKVSYHKISVSRDFGNKMEVVSGLKANQEIVLDAPDGLAEGSAVKTQVAQGL